MKIIRIFLFFSLILLAGCGKKEFSIDFSLPQELNANYKLIYYASDRRGGFIRESAVAINGGKGDFKGPTINPALVYIYVGPKAYPLMVYAERGDKISISGKETAPAKWTVGGNDINEEWSQWRNANADALSSADAEKINDAVKKYVTANPDNPLSALLLLTTFSRIDDEETFRTLWRSLKGDAADSKWTHLVGRSDQPGIKVSPRSRLYSMALRSASKHEVDTLRTDSVKATLIYFWMANVKERKDMMDSVKALVKEYPDSALRNIADICLDPDSLSWRSQIRKDSLKKVVRMWAPAGFADEKIMTLNVPRVPFFMVVDSVGNQNYRGSEPDSAFKAFRRLMKK